MVWVLARRFVNRLGLVLAGAIVFGVCAGGSAAVVAPTAQMSGLISFYGDVGNPVDSPYLKNPLLVRPSKLLLAEDGSVALLDLRWRGWGSRVARAAGVLSAASCTPNCAAGKRTTSPAHLALSRPGRVLGHEVYRCFQLTVPSHPQSNMHDCLKRTGTLTAYSPVSKPAPSAPAAGSVVHLPQFLSPNRKTWCSLDDIPNLHQAWCGSVEHAAVGGNAPTGHQYSAQVNPAGKVVVCSWAPSSGPNSVCMQNWNSSAPVLTAGQSDQLYQYRCSSVASGITCTVITGPGKGKGFRISANGITRIGASAPPTTTRSPTLGSFYTGRLGWYCSMAPGGVDCEDSGKGHTASLSPNGKVTICTAGVAACKVGNAGIGIPTLHVGKQVTIKPFRCSYTTSGLTCVVLSTGRGFRLDKTTATRVG